MIELGSVYPAALDVFDAAGNPVNPSAVTLTFTLPDGTAVTPTVTLPPAVTGQLRLAWPTTMPGRHAEKWQTFNPDIAWRNVFDVGTDDPPAIFSLADGKQVVGIDAADTSDDGELRAKIAAITSAIENYKQETIARRSITQKQCVRCGARLRLWNTPVISLDSVVSRDGTITWDTTQLDVDADTGLVDVMSGPPIAGHVVTVHTAGMAVIPYHYLEGAKVLLQFEWEAREGAGSVAAGIVGPEEAQDYKQYGTFPRKVREWLGSPGLVVA